MICEKCFKQIDDDSSFCTYCGASQTISGNYNKGNLIIYSHNKKFGFKDKDTLEIVIPLKYDFIGSFSDNRAVVMINFKYGYVDKNGKEITRLKYDFAKESKDGYAPVKRDDKWSIIDINCKEITPFKYDSIDYFIENLAVVSISNKFSLINKSGEEITHKFYDKISKFNENIACVKLDDKYGIIDNKGNEIIPLIYDSIDNFSNRTLKVKEKQKIGLLEKNGRILIPCLYDNIVKLPNGVFKLTSANKIGFYFMSGKIIDCQYEELKILGDGSLATRKEKKWICFNNLGEDISNESNNYLNFVKKIKRRKRNNYIIGISFFTLLLLLFLVLLDNQNSKVGIIKSTENNHNTFQIKERDVKNAVYDYLRKNMGTSVNYITSLYADNVDFYNSGVVDKKFIIKDKKEYFSKWPERDVTLSSNIDVNAGIKENTWLARFSYHYKVKNSFRKLEGNAWCQLTFKDTDNSLLIISEKGKIKNTNKN